MTTFTETKVLQSLEIFPALNVINVKYQNTTLKDGVKFMEQTEAKSYSTSQFSDFAIDVAPTGGTLAEIVAGFSQAALDAASAVPATLTAKDTELTAAAAANTAALSAATVAHTAALATKDAELATAATAHASAIATLEATHTAALAAKDAIIAGLQAQVETLTPVVSTADPLGPVVNDLQIRLAMNKVGLRKAVEAAVAASIDQSLKDWYERAKNFKRHDPMVLSMIHSLGVSDADADSLFALAATLQG